MNVEKIAQQALDELREEAFRDAVDAEKRRILSKPTDPWWHRVIPFTIKIERRT